MMNSPGNEMSKSKIQRNCFLQVAVNLESQLAEAMGHTLGDFVGNIESGYFLIDGRKDSPLPKYVRDPGETFALMCEYNCVPDRSSLQIPYAEGWAYVSGTKARVNLEPYASLQEAYAVVIAMAVIEKLKQ
jgi:hypothetical protein